MTREGDLTSVRFPTNNRKNVMDKDLLVAIAEAVLTKLLGQGSWRTFEHSQFEPIEDPIVGLVVGDSVWNYDEDDELQLKETKVLCVENGIAYVYWSSSYYGPSLIGVSKEWGKTKEEAVELWRETILSDIEYHEGKSDKIESLKSLLNETNPTERKLP